MYKHYSQIGSVGNCNDEVPPIPQILRIETFPSDLV